MAHDLITAPLIVPNALHHGPAKSRAAHVLYGGVQGSENALADIHGVVDLPGPLDGVVPQVPHSALAVVLRILQRSLPHFYL